MSPEAVDRSGLTATSRASQDNHAPVLSPRGDAAARQNRTMSHPTESNHRPTNYHIIDDFACARVRFNARRIARWLSLNQTAREDLAQNIFLALCKAAPSFDPTVASSRTFVSRVIHQAALHEFRTMKRATACAVRNPRLLTDCTEESFELIACPTSFGYARYELRADVSLRIRALPSRTALVARHLMHSTQAQAARALGISRQAVHAHVAALRNTRPLLLLHADF